MKFCAVNDCTWLYPDSEIKEQVQEFYADAAKGGSFGIQLLTDFYPSEAVSINWTFQAAAGITCTPHQLIPSRVEENSGKDTFTEKKNFKKVAHFVTKKAPFEVFEAARPLDQGTLKAGRTALYLLFEVSEETEAGEYPCRFTFRAGGERLEFSFLLSVHSCVIPKSRDSEFIMINWLTLPDIAKNHRVELYSEPFWEIVEKYLDNQIGLRNNHFKLMGGEPVRDARGKVVDFDFSVDEKLGDLALKHGFTCIYGGFVARWRRWTCPDQHLLWEKDEVSTSSVEGYRQLSLYFRKLQKIVEKHGWKGQYMQCLVDEPQMGNAESYRVLAGICRRFMPGIQIHDPVETPDLMGAVDIWNVKQAVYEKYLPEFQYLQSLGEKLTVYTCGFPAGYWMNRSTDLPLPAGRLPMWMCAKYGLCGFLHWGYNNYGDRDPYEHNCYYVDEERSLPPGDAFIVYPGEDGRPWNSVRSFLQRFAAEDYEILIKLPEEKRRMYVNRLCDTFEDYESDPKIFEQVRREMLREF